MNEIKIIVDELKVIREEMNKMNEKIDNLQVEMNGKIDNLQVEMNGKIDNLQTETKGIRNNLSEVRQICRGIEEKSQFWGAIKERVDIISYNNENLQFDINKNFVRKDNIVQELKKAL